MHTDMGHRDRVKERFRKDGLENFHEVHVLELLLFYAVPRKDTKDLARLLLDRFGSLSAVLGASTAELEMVPGVGKGISTYLTLISAASHYYWEQKANTEVILDTPEKYCPYLIQKLFGKRDETVYLLCLDAKNKMLSCQLVGQGDVNSANIPVRRMVEIALGAKATSVVLAHNHPSGIAVPSREDVLTTRQLATALGAMDIVLADHVVVADRDCTSMVQSHLYNPWDYCC